MAHMPNELVQMIAQNVSKKDLPMFRLASRIYRAFAQDSFAHKCFEDILTTLTVVSLDHLFSAVSHEEYGPNIKTITFQTNGVDDSFALARRRIINIIRALQARGQKVDIKFVVTAMALPQSTLHDYSIATFYEYIMSNAHRLDVLPGPIKISIPSPVPDYSISPARRDLAASIGLISRRRETHITYTDGPGSIIYDPATLKLTMTGLKVRHIHEVSALFGQTLVYSLSITNTDADVDSLLGLLRSYRGSLGEIEFRDISLYTRGPGGFLRTASWYRVMERIAFLNIFRLELSNLKAGSVVFGVPGDAHVVSLFAVGMLAVIRGITNELVRLRRSNLPR